MKNNKASDKTSEEVVTNTKNAQKDLFMEYVPFFIIIFFVVIIRLFIATPVKVNGTSMYPTLHNKDHMLLYKLTKRVRGIKRFDIVVIKTDSGKLIKRVIGLPGDKIRYEVLEEDGKVQSNLYINDKIVKEDFISDDIKKSTCHEGVAICDEGITIPEGEYYVMGDNRINSKDSRMIGTIPEDEIMGTTELILFPFDRIGKVK